MHYLINIYCNLNIYVLLFILYYNIQVIKLIYIYILFNKQQYIICYFVYSTHTHQFFILKIKIKKN